MNKYNYRKIPLKTKKPIIKFFIKIMENGIFKNWFKKF